MFNTGNVVFCFLVGVDGDVLFEGDSSEKIDFKGDMVFYETFESITNSNDVTLLDDFGIFALEESFSWTGLISEDTVDHGDFETLFGIDSFGYGGNDLSVDVVSGSMSLKVLYFDKSGFVESFVLSHELSWD